MLFDGRVRGVPALQGQEVRRLQRGAGRDRGGDGPRHRQQQGHLAGAHQPPRLLPQWYHYILL